MVAGTGDGTYFLFSNQTSDANSAPVAISYQTATAKVWGTFGGATVKFQTLAPQTSPNVWIDVPDIDGTTMTFTTNRQATLQFLVHNEQLRAVLSGSSGTTTINVSLETY